MDKLTSMNFRVPVLSLTIIGLASLFSLVMDKARKAEDLNRLTQWIELHERWTSGAKQSVPNVAYWRWRAPIAAGRLQQMGSVNPQQVLSVGAGQEVWAVNEAAYLGHGSIPTQSIPLLAVSTASFLGIALPDDPQSFSVISSHILGGLNPWHSLL